MIKNKHIITVIRSAAVLAAAVLILKYPSEASQSTVKSINVCINSIIPSMFAFMVLSTYIQTSGLYRILFRPVLFIMRKIIRADDTVISIFLLSLFGGYPVGLKLLSENIAQNKNYPAIKDMSENAATFCYCISPAFALIMLGSGVMGSTAAGTVIYISNVLACLTTAIFVSRITNMKSMTSSEEDSTGNITDSINSASRSLLVICSVIIAFNTVLACVISLLADFGADVPVLAAGVAEISNLLTLDNVPVNIIPIISAIASMGGVCVLLQCLAMVNRAFSVKKFLLARIPCALLSGIYTYFILKFTDISVETSAVSAVYNYSFSANKIIVPVLIAMCIIIFYRSDKNTKKV